MIDSSLQPIIITAGDGLVRRFNLGARNLLGYTAEEVVGKKYIQDIYEGDSDREILQQLTRKGGGAVDREGGDKALALLDRVQALTWGLLHPKR